MLTQEPSGDCGIILIAARINLTSKHLESYCAKLVETHSWSTVKVDCWGFKFFWQFVLEKEWQWVNIVKPPKVKSLPDILPPSEIEQLIGITRKLRYRVFLLTTYSMGLRLRADSKIN